MKQYYYGNAIASVREYFDENKNLQDMGFTRISFFEYLLHEILREFMRLISKNK
jgi:hypothetical protein